MIDEDPTIYLDAKGGVPQEERQALTDEQVERLLDTIRDLPPYVFVMIGLYAGLRGSNRGLHGILCIWMQRLRT